VLLELILIIANIGTAIVLITLLKRQHEILMFSYVAASIMECVFLLVGIIAVLGNTKAASSIANAPMRLFHWLSSAHSVHSWSAAA
jgi:hypothetical protein